MKRMNCVIFSAFMAVFFIGGNTLYGDKGKNRPSNLERRTPTIKPDWTETVKIDGKKYKKIHMTPDKLTRKFGKGLDLGKYKGYYYQAVLPDIHHIADSIATDPLIDSVKIVDSLTALVYIRKNNFILKYGIEALDPEDGEYSGFEIYRLPMPAPYLPIYPDYPKDKPEVMEKRTPYLRTFVNPDGSCTAILTIQPTSYPIKEGKEIKWIDISPDEPISQSALDILMATETLGETYYVGFVEVDNDGLGPSCFVHPSSENYIELLGAGKENGGLTSPGGFLNYHLYQRVASQFSTSGFPAYETIDEVEYRTKITNYYPQDKDIHSGSDWAKYEDGYEIWPWLRNFTHKPQNCGSSCLDCFNDAWDGTIYYNGNDYIWDKGDGYVYAKFNSSGKGNFRTRISSGWYAIGIVDKAENNQNPDYWEGIVVLPSYDQLKVTYTPPSPPNAPSNCQASDDQCYKIIVTWNDNSTDEKWFRVYCDGSYLTSVGANVTGYTHNTTGTHSYYVKAKNDYGESSASNSDNGTVLTIPTAPSNCQASDDQCGKIVVTWRDNSNNEQSFSVYRDGSYKTSVSANVTSWTDNTTGTHSYYVKAGNGCGLSSASNSDNGTVLTIPTAPSNCQASDNQCDKIVVTWNDNSNNESGFKIYRDGSYYTSVSANVTSWTNHTTGTRSYYVKSYNTCGNSSASNSDNGTCLTVPSAPSNCQASDDQCDKVVVTWNDNSTDEDGFEIYRNGSLAHTAGANQTSWTYNCTLPGTFSFYVKAYNQCGESSQSNTDNGTCLTIPTAPSNCQASDDQCYKIVVTWSYPSGADGCNIYRDGSKIGNVSCPGGTYTDNTTGTHSYYIKCYNICGESSASNSVNGTALTKPTAPSNCQASDDQCYKIVVTWNDNSSNESGFKIYRDGSLAHTSGANQTNWTYNCTSPGTYSFYVKAYNTCGESSVSNSDNGTALTKPDAPTNCQAWDSDNDSIMVEWQDNSNNEDGFKIYRDNSPSPIDSVPTNQIRYLDQPTGGSVYYYCVKAYNVCGESEATCDSGQYAVEELKIVVPKTFYLSQNSPNPVYSTTRISFGVPKEIHIVLEIYNLSGKRVCTLKKGMVKEGWHTVIWNGKDDSGKRVARGIYFYRMVTGDYKATRKLTIIR